MRHDYKQNVIRMIAVLVLVALLSVNVSAAVPDEGYCYDRYNQSVPAPTGYASDMVYYATEHGTSLEMADDLYAYEEELYLLKKDTGEIDVFDGDLVLKRNIRFYRDGEELSVKGAMGMCIDDRQGEPYIYIADTENHRVLCATMDGQVFREYVKPDNALYPQEMGFNPTKVLVGADGLVYVIVQGLFKGAATFSQEGEFLGFFGTNIVDVTAAVLLDYFWKNLMNEEQLSRTENSTPIEYTNFTVDSAGFIYTCTRKSESNTGEIKRLNAQGNNILPRNNYGDYESTWNKSQYLNTAFVDIALLNDSIIAALDNTRGRVFLYTNDGGLLLTFGDAGSFEGGFKSPMAIETLGDKIYVMDPYKNCITRFSPTEYGKTLIEAASLFQDGEHILSREKWETVLRYNANCEAAYSGIGNALMAEGNYKEAMKYFQLGGQRGYYSQAYDELRKETAAKAVIPVLIGLVVVLIIAALWRRYFCGPKVERNVAKEGIFYQYRYTMAHPIKGFEVLLKRETGSLVGVVVVSVVAMLFATILFRQQNAFIFNPYQTEKLDIGLIVALIGGMYAIFVAVNRLVCTVFDGNGSVLEIAVVTACALIPTAIALVIHTGLSHFLIISEQVLLDTVLTIGFGWSLIVLLAGLSFIQEYSFKQIAFSFILTLAGMVLALFVLLLGWTLFQQIASFFVSIVKEITVMQV